MKRASWVAAAMAIGTSGCMTPEGQSARATGERPAAGAQIANAAGETVATAHIFQVRDRLRVEVEANALRPGTYGVHIHQAGRCDGPDFQSAGPHWNPTARQHGLENSNGAHKGDLPNLEVGADGHGLILFGVEQASVRGRGTPLIDADGAAIVIHAQADDNRTDPSGNSGARIACGVIR